MNVALPAVVGALASLAVALLSAYLTAKGQRQGAAIAAQQELRKTYLNPLRFHLAENHFRFALTLSKLDQGDGRYPELDVLEDPASLTGRDSEWFTGTGVRIATGIYLNACLFAHIARVLDGVPYLRLGAAEDTRLTELLLQVQISFVRSRGVPYSLQPSIGHDMWRASERRLLTYREFCEILSNPETRAWLDPLIRFHVETARAEKLARVFVLVDAIEELTNFLDKFARGGKSAFGRAEIEKAVIVQYSRAKAEMNSPH